MAKVTTYLNFPGNTEEAFTFYRDVFGTEFEGDINRMGDVLEFGNNISINLEPDTKEETESLFEALSEGGKVTMPLAEMFWGAYFGALTDRFGVQWMFNCAL